MSSDLTRRTFLAVGAVAALTTLARGESASSKFAEEPEKVEVPPVPGKKVGIALVGLGKLSIEEILPGFEKSEHVRLTGLVSGHPEKAKALAARYQVKPANIYGYDNFDAIRDNPEIDAVYIVLPNALHREYVERAAKAGKHVLCEKPMATSADDCRKMIAACKDAGKQLMIAYRMHYEPITKKAKELIQSGKLGKPKVITAQNTQMQEGGTWRTDKALAGGGAMSDIGIYCLNTTRFLLGEEPVAVQATTYSTPGDSRFKSVEEYIGFSLKFASGAILSAAASYGAATNRFYRVIGEKGILQMDNAYAYHGEQLFAQPKVKDPSMPTELTAFTFSDANQFALEMDHFGECVLNGKPNATPGEEGLRDQLLMEAIYQSAATGRPVRLDGDATMVKE